MTETEENKKPKPTNFIEAAKQYQQETGCSEAEAISICEKEYPEFCKELLSWAEMIQRPKTFTEAVRRRIKETGCTEKQAEYFCERQYPALHKEMQNGAKQD